MKGNYIILAQLSRKRRITIGRLGDIQFHPGYYAYVGSAMSGLKPRLSRHLKSNKKLHWHIDYLLAKALVKKIIVSENRNGSKIECAIARQLEKELDFITGFGSSDCKCKSHLFFAFKQNPLVSIVLKTFNKLNLSPQCWSA